MTTSFDRYNHLLICFLGILLLLCEAPLSLALQVRLPIPTTTTRLHVEPPVDSSSRRGFLATALTTPLAIAPQPAHAGLIQFPCKTLKNRYHFMRAGPSELERDGVYSTNPLFLTNRENALVTSSVGTKAVLDACAAIKASPNFPTVAYHSLAANGMDTADMMATELRISRDRLLPEFTYLDQRGIGLWDSGSVDDVYEAMVALDFLEGGKNGVGGRPPANEDGTPNETLGDQFVRLRQFLSLQESRTSGENILIIFPDGTGPALLSAMIAGISLNEAHCLDYAPGEVRLDISRESILEQYEQKKEDPAYLARIEVGKEKLAVLRSQEGDEVVNLKDQLREKERAILENEFALKKQKEREEEDRKRQELRELQLQREEEQKERAAQAKQLQLEKQQVAAAKKAEQDSLRAAKRRQQAATMPSTEETKSMDTSAILGVLGVGVLGVGAAAVLGGGDDEDSQPIVSKPPAPTPNTNTAVVMGANGTAAVVFAPSPTDVNEDVKMELPLPKASSSAGQARPASATPELQLDDDKAPILDEEDKPEELKPSSAIEEELNSLEAAHEALFNTVDSTVPPPKLTQPDEDEDAPPIDDEDNETVDQEMNRLEAAQEAMNDYFGIDDGANDWLQVLAEIRDEPDEEADRVNGEGRY